MGTEFVDTEAIISNPPSSSGRMFLFYQRFLPFLCFIVYLLRFVCFIVYASVIVTGKEATMPTLITLIASLPQFQCPFTMTSVPPNPFQTGVAYEEEALDKAWSCFMEGMYLLNEVSLCTKTCS